MDEKWKEIRNKLLTIKMGYCAINSFENRNYSNMFSNLKNEKKCMN